MALGMERNRRKEGKWNEKLKKRAVQVSERRINVTNFTGES